jgi:predicted amidohydrolase YtcJ
MKYALFVLTVCLLSSCFKGEQADLIIHNAQIYSLNLHGDVFEAMAIRDGKIIELGSEREILNKYHGPSINAEKKEIYPGFHDAHGHLFSLAQKKLSADLTGCKSMNEVVQRLERYDAMKKNKVLVGKGWDQSLWSNQELPDNTRLNELFPEKAVILYRVDGHAVLANDFALRKAGITPSTIVEGGAVLSQNDTLTGVLLDNAIQLVDKLIPETKNKKLKEAILECQEELLEYGITSVHEAGITIDQLELLKDLERDGKLKIQIYAMLFPGEKEIAFAREKGILKTPFLHVRSFKVIGDGALGSRGACLTHPYHDAPHTHGFMLLSHEELKRLASIAVETGYQLNVHAIGDSTNRIVLRIMQEALKGKVDHRWRIEHAQIVHPSDIPLFGEVGIIPSVQPTHAVSDMRFVKSRLGEKREKWGYAYKSLLKASGIIALGTDFPVEDINPFLTIEASVNRKNPKGEPKNGYLKNEGLTLMETIKGMTLWAAMACFEENEKGSLEPYKEATFIILHNSIQQAADFSRNYAKEVFVRGQSVYKFN